MKEIYCNVVLMKEGDVWAAQGLHYDIAAQGSTIPAAKQAFVLSLMAQVALALHFSEEPLATFEPAPKIYWDRFQNAELLAQPIGMPHPMPMHEPMNAPPPAFMIESLLARDAECRIFS